MSRFAGVLAAIALLLFLPLTTLAVSGELPSNARSGLSGSGVDCLKIYVETQDGCQEILLPEHVYLTGDNDSSGWAREVGFGQTSDSIRKPKSLEDAQLIGATPRGLSVCRRGIRVDNDQCIAISLPASAYLPGARFDRAWDWECGYRASGGDSVAISVPIIGYVDASDKVRRYGFALNGER